MAKARSVGSNLNAGISEIWMEVRLPALTGAAKNPVGIWVKAARLNRENTETVGGKAPGTVPLKSKKLAIPVIEIVSTAGGQAVTDCRPPLRRESVFRFEVRLEKSRLGMLFGMLLIISERNEEARYVKEKLFVPDNGNSRVSRLPKRERAPKSGIGPPRRNSIRDVFETVLSDAPRFKLPEGAEYPMVRVWREVMREKSNGMVGNKTVTLKSCNDVTLARSEAIALLLTGTKFPSTRWARDGISESCLMRVEIEASIVG